MTIPHGYHAARLPADRRQHAQWPILQTYYFAGLVAPDDCMLDLGAGYGHFIHAAEARRRIAIEKWPGFLPFLAAGVAWHVGPAANLAILDDRTIGFTFACNLFGHLVWSDLKLELADLRSNMPPGEALIILQPKYRYAYLDSFADDDHTSRCFQISRPQYLISHGRVIIDVEPRFMPLTIKGQPPASPWLLQL